MDKFPEDETFQMVHSGLQGQPEIPKDVRAADIRRNKLRELSFAENNVLEYLDASDNEISNISPIDNLKALKILDCSYNLIRKIPVLSLEHLEELYLIANDIKTIENVSFAKLIKLDLANNEIKTIENINAANLEELYLSTNKISNICDLTGFKRLKVLDLQYNDLTNLDCSLLPSTLEVLMLQGNTKLYLLENLDAIPNLKILSLKYTKVKGLKSTSSLEIW